MGKDYDPNAKKIYPKILYVDERYGGDCNSGKTMEKAFKTEKVAQEWARDYTYCIIIRIREDK